MSKGKGKGSGSGSGNGIEGYDSSLYYADLLAEGKGFSLQKNTHSTGQKSIRKVSGGKGKGN